MTTSWQGTQKVGEGHFLVYESIENGILESFNSVILEARTKPLLTMLEEIRMYVADRFYRMSTKHLTWSEDVCPIILTKVSKNKEVPREN